MARGDAGQFATTTQLSQQITGTMDLTLFELDVGVVTPDVDKIHVCLIPCGHNRYGVF